MTEIQIIAQLLHKIELLEKQVAVMSHHISVLEEKLSRYEHPQNSGNSSIPPSQDLFRAKRTISYGKRAERILAVSRVTNAQD